MSPRVTRGTVQTARWSPERRELERILADGQWHPVLRLQGQVGSFVDPRMAIRAWLRDVGPKYAHVDDDLDQRDRVVIDEMRKVRYGRAQLVRDMIRGLVGNGRCDVRGKSHTGRWTTAEVRLAGVAAGEAEIPREGTPVKRCPNGHLRPPGGYGKRGECQECKRGRDRRRRFKRKLQLALNDGRLSMVTDAAEILAEAPECEPEVAV